jgi:hypothetical protein
LGSRYEETGKRGQQSNSKGAAANDVAVGFAFRYSLPFHHSSPRFVRRSSRISENIEEKCSFFMAGLESPKRVAWLALPHQPKLFTLVAKISD